MNETVPVPDKAPDESREETISRSSEGIKRNQDWQRPTKTNRIALQGIWAKLRSGMTVKQTAVEYGIDCKTVSRWLLRDNAKEYRKLIRQMRRGKRKRIPGELLDKAERRLESGEPLMRIAKELGVWKRALQCELREAIGRQRYEDIMTKKRRTPIPVNVLGDILTHVTKGESLWRLSKERGLSYHTLHQRLVEKLGKRRWQSIIQRRRRQLPRRLLRKLMNELTSGEPLKRLARMYGIPPTTLKRRLEQTLGTKEYSKIMDGRTGREYKKISPALLRRALNDLESGVPTSRIVKMYGIRWLTLRAALQRLIGIDQYRQIMRETEPLKRKTPLAGFGSPEARRQGADSLLELRVRTALQKNGVSFGFHKDLEIGKKWYVPDFILDHTIIEVAGVSTDRYWRRCRQKIMDYLESGYSVVVVTPSRIRKKAYEYLPKSRVIIAEIEGVLKNIGRFLSQMGINSRGQLAGDSTS